MQFEDFFSAHKADGSVEEDVEFTISLEGMSSRFATFQNENRAYYLLRLVQSLVRAGASEIHIKSTRRSIEISVQDFSSRPDWLSPDTLLELLQQPRLWNRDFEGVAAAFLCLRDKAFQAVQWCHGNRQLVVSPQSGTSEVTDAPRPSGELYFKVTKPFRFLSSATAPEHLECLSRIVSTRTAITFDGRLLTAPSPTRQMQLRTQKLKQEKKLKQPPAVHLFDSDEDGTNWFREYSAEYLLIEAETAKPPNQGWVALNESCGEWQAPGAWAPLKVFLPSDHEPYVHLAVSPRLEGVLRIWPILDGVIATRPIESERFPALEGYVDAPNYGTDLSGLVVLEGDSLVTEAGRFYHSILLQLREFSHSLDASWNFSYPEFPLTKVSLAITGLASMGGLLQPIVAVPPALAIDVVTSRLRFALRRQAFTDMFREEILCRVDDLLQRYPEEPLP